MLAEMLDFDDAGDFHEFCIRFADCVQNEISEIVFVSRLDGEARNLPWRGECDQSSLGSELLSAITDRFLGPAADIPQASA